MNVSERHERHTSPAAGAGITALLFAATLTAWGCKSPEPLDFAPVGCAELRALQSGEVQCQLSPERPFSVLLDPTSTPSGVSVALVALHLPSGEAVILAPPTRTGGLLQGLTVPEGVAAGEGQLEVLAGDDLAPPPETGPSRAIARWLNDARDDAQAGREAVAIISAPEAAFPAGSPAGDCLEAYTEAREGVGGGAPAHVDACQAAVDDPGSAADPRAGWLTRYWLGHCHFWMNDPKRAAARFEQSADVAQEAGLIKAQIEALRWAGHAHQVQGQLDQAAQLFDRGLSVAESRGDLGDQAQMLRKQGDLAAARRELSTAAQKLTQAAALAEQVGDRDLKLNVHFTLSQLFVDLSAPLEAHHALSYLMANVPPVEPETGTEELDWAARLLGKIGSVRAALRADPTWPTEDTAQAILDEALIPAFDLWKRLGDSTQAAIAAHDIAYVLTEDAPERTCDQELSAQIKEARRWFQIAEQEDQQGFLNVNLRILEAELADQECRWDEALAAVQSLAELEADPEHPTEIGPLVDLERALILTRRGEPGAAMALATQGLDTLEQLALGPGLADDRERYLEDNENLYQIAEAAALQSGDTLAALNLAERRRQAFAMASRLRGCFEGDGDRARLTRLTSLNEEVARLQEEQALAHILPDAEREALRTRLSEASLSRDNLWAAMVRGCLGTSPSGAPRPLDLARLTEELAVDERLLLFSATRSRLVAYRISPGGAVEARILDTRPDDAYAEIRRLRDTWTDAAAEAIPQNSTRAALEAQLADVLSWALDAGASSEAVTRLGIIPYGALYRLPFAAVEVEGQPLIHLSAVSLYPSLGGWLERRIRAPHDPWTSALALGDPAPRSLATTEVEARAVAQQLGGATVLIGEQATRQAMLDHLRDADVVHYAGHGGWWDPVAGRCRGDLGEPAPSFAGATTQDASRRLERAESCLLLADGGWLRRGDLIGWRSAAELVVLSGCTTGGGAAVGANLGGLPTGLLASGVQAVVGTYWPIRQGDALPIMKDFYKRATVPGSRMAEAWRQTVAAAKAGDLGERQTRRAVWAAFALWGDSP